MAKPLARQASSGLHVHVSLLEQDGANLFARDEQALGHAIAGLQATMAEAMLVFAPNANSYRRLRPLSYAPTAPTWGYNNRTVALRIPTGPPSARRIEHRLAGADANPYLVLAAVLAGIHHGLSAGLDTRCPDRRQRLCRGRAEPAAELGPRARGVRRGDRLAGLSRRPVLPPVSARVAPPSATASPT